MIEVDKMANREIQNLPDPRPMVGGDGVYSYANNSAYQVITTVLENLKSLTEIIF